MRAAVPAAVAARLAHRDGDRGPRAGKRTREAVVPAAGLDTATVRTFEVNTTSSEMTIKTSMFVIVRPW